MIVKVNGVDLTPYIALGGLKWQRNDVDGPNTGRGLDGNMIRDRVGTKIRLDCTCRPLTSSELSIVLNAIEPVFVQATYTDPMLGREVTKTMYSNNIPATFLFIKPDGTEWWEGVAFPLIEK